MKVELVARLKAYEGAKDEKMDKVTYEIDVDGFHGIQTLILTGIPGEMVTLMMGDRYRELMMSADEVKVAEKSIRLCNASDCTCGGYPFPMLAQLSDQPLEGTDRLFWVKEEWLGLSD